MPAEPALSGALGSGFIEAGTHVFPLRVYYEDTDAAGIVYYANYLKFAERARTELLRYLEVEQTRLSAEQDVGFVVRRCEVDYLAPARLDDSLEVHTRLLEVGGASFQGKQVVKRGDTELVKLAVRLACVRSNGRPTRLPRPLRDSLEQMSGREKPIQ
jgi:acyl-CoA thioester hydrolase